MLELLTARLHVRQRAAGAALRHPERLRQPLPPRDARRSEPARAARPGQHPDGHVLCQPDVAGAARQVAAREHPRHAAAAAAAERARADGDTARTAQPRSVRERLEQHRRNPACASCHARWIRSGSRSRTSTRSDAGGRVDAGRADRRLGRAAGRHDVRRAGRAAAVLLRPAASSSSRTVDREAADLRARPRPRDRTTRPAVRQIVREAAAEDYRWSSLILGHRQEHAVSDEEVGVMIVQPRRPFRAGPSCAASGATLALPLLDGMVPALTALAERPASRVRRLGVVYVPNGMVMDAAGRRPRRRRVGVRVDADPAAAGAVPRSAGRDRRLCRTRREHVPAARSTRAPAPGF